MPPSSCSPSGWESRTSRRLPSRLNLSYMYSYLRPSGAHAPRAGRCSRTWSCSPACRDPSRSVSGNAPSSGLKQSLGSSLVRLGDLGLQAARTGGGGADEGAVAQVEPPKGGAHTHVGDDALAPGDRVEKGPDRCVSPRLPGEKGLRNNGFSRGAMLFSTVCEGITSDK